jgi:phosphate transport system substrate-binding protein
MMTRRVLIGLFALAMALHVTQLIHASNGAQSQTARSVQHQSIFPLVDSKFSDPAEDSPGISIILDGADEGIRSLLDKECEVAMASRKMRAEEIREAEARGMDIRETAIGGVGIGVAAHPANPVDELTVDQVRKIFDGTIANWKQVGGAQQSISIVTIGAAGSKISGYLTQPFPGEPMRQIASQEKQSLEESNEVALVLVGKTELQPKMKLLAIKKSEQTQGFLPSPKNLNSGLYPFGQPLYLYIDWKHAPDHAKAFFTFCAAGNSRTAGE